MDDGRKGIFMSVKKNAHSGEHAHAGYMMKGWKLKLQKKKKRHSRRMQTV
jgi:hypothetical protein